MSLINSLIEDYSNRNLILFLRSKIPGFRPEEEDLDYLFDDERYDKYSEIKKLGEAEIDHDDLIVLSAKTKEILTERSGKKKQYEIAKKILKEENKDSAIFVFYDEEGNFRFSFIRANYTGRKRDFTDFKRYTYYVSPQLTNKTFIKQIEACDFSSLDAIIEAFSVEPLNKEFYREIAKAFYSLIGGTVKIGNRNEEFDTQLQLPSHPPTDRKLYQEFAVRLIGRTIFTWFLKNKKSEAGVPLIPNTWLSSQTVKKLMDEKKNYYHEYLEKLFFLVLNKKEEDRDVDILPGEYWIIPFLNGGLFEAQADDFFPKDRQGKHQVMYNLKIPNRWFYDLFQTLEQFNFTIDENSLNDAEVSIDPEMLGTIFENLLAEIDPDTQNSARNATGSFYTPREVVDYMVEQSLVQSLINKTGINKEKEFKELFKEGGSNLFSQSETRSILKVLGELKIIDPAAGSGAFPMGALHKIIMALKKLDPGAHWWKQQLLGKIHNSLAKKEFKEKLDKENSDYIRKLGVIQHSIYGVDIQPIASEISKLRSFLSLIIDENIDDKAPNRGIKPLPNLEFNFVTANTLIKLPEKVDSVTKQYDAFDKLFDDELDRLKELREEYLQSYGEEKERIKEEYLKIQVQIVKNKNGKDILVPDSRAFKLSSWNPFNNEASPWFDPEWMFGVDKFDIVIGNPPYIQLQKSIPGKNIKYADLYKDEGYETFERTGDIYALFYERGLDIARDKGILTYITSNKWMRAGYGKSLRQFLSKYNPKILIDLGPGVFSNATVDTNILLVEKTPVPQHHLRAITLTDKEKLHHLEDKDFTILTGLGEESWVILSPEQQQIKEKIERIGTPLKDWDINIYRGILTGYNEAFIIDGRLKDELIKQDPKSAEILKPILRGRDIKRYKANFADKWIIATFPAKKIDINTYPAVKRFLEGFRPKIDQTGKNLTEDEKQKIIKHAETYGIQLKYNDLKKSRKKTGNKWFETQDQIGYYNEFKKEKIMWKIIGSNINFYFDTKKYFANNAINVMTSSSENLKFLTSIFNSEIMDFYFKKFIFIEVEGGGIQMFNTVMRNIPFPKIPPSQQVPFEKLVDQIIAGKEKGEDTTALERQIDLMVYKLYELTYDEVKIVDPAFEMEEEEYEEYRLINV